MPLDEAYYYCRHLELNLQQPTLFKVCNAINAIDLALMVDSESRSPRMSVESWSQVRDRLFNVMLSSFPGHFLVYRNGRDEHLDPQAGWPKQGAVRFYPDNLRRKNESYEQDLARLDPGIALKLKELFLSRTDRTTSEDFSKSSAAAVRENGKEERAFLDRLYAVCEDQAEKEKSRAQLNWCQLQEELSNCDDRLRRRELQRMIKRLQTLWGLPAQKTS